MNRKWSIAGLALAAFACAAAVSIDVNHPLLNSHIGKLRAGNSMTIAFTVNRIGSAIDDQKLVIGKPGLLRWESAGMLVIANGSTIVTLDKKSNEYTEEPQTPEALRKVLANDAIWHWSAMVDEAFLKPVTDAKTGASRKVKGVAVKEVNVARGQKIVTLFVDDQLGFARGSTYQEESEGHKNTTLVIASELKLGAETLSATDKMFAAPAGAKKVEKLAKAAGWKEVAPIFSARCGCHINSATAGLSLASYRGIMNGSRSGAVVVAGDPDNSIILQAIKGTRAPKMPPQGNLSAEQIDAIAAWIKDGAKE